MDSLQQVVDSLQGIVVRNNVDNDLVRRVTWVIAIPFAIAFAFIIFVVYRSRREARFRQKEAELNREISEVEMKALRSQLNPHFIFNCLNSIHQFVHSNDTTSASNYLVKFSRLMRLVLENSTHQEVPLQDDIDALTMYMEMEQLRMNHVFDFNVNISPEINSQYVLVPPLIIQPFVENSIWHGLNGKKANGKIVISISKSGEMLQYVVEDNGQENKVNDLSEKIKLGKKKSLGMSLTRERIEIINKTKGVNASFHSSDLKDGNGNYSGKRVVLCLPYLEEN
jgi:LytS/YehU family sensor histidine kinase